MNIFKQIPGLGIVGALCAVTALTPAARAASPTHATLVTPGGMTVEVDAVDRDIFHIVAYPTGNPKPSTSPFVVEGEMRKGVDCRQGASGVDVTIPSGGLSMTPSGAFTVASKGRALLRSCTIEESNGTITLKLRHGAGERLYGAGNAGINWAGDLTHPSDHQYVGNGCTRVPFLWSPAGWSMVVANDRNGGNWNDADGTLTWTMPGPDIDLYLTVDKDPYGILDAESRLTGRAPIPPRWTFGYMISRWGYRDAADVQDKWHQFRDRHIPVDAFIYDYDWFVDDWNFNPKTFPDPKANLAEMHKMGLKFVGIRKPRVNGANLDYAKSKDWVIPSSQGFDLRFEIPAARSWWWSHHIPLVQDGVDGWWNDEAEQTIDEFFYMSMVEWTGGRAASPKRVWSISRAFALGMQRFGAAAWSGDINSTWDTLRNQPGTLLNWSLAGMPYVSQDNGGFQGNPDPEMYTRWVEESAYTPVMRSHGTWNSDRWPWAFGKDAEAAMTKAIELRYRLVPYLYTCADKTTSTGAPMMRPLFFDFPNDARTFNLEDEWLVGPDLLAAPVITKGGHRDVYLPAGKWYDFNTNAAIAGGKTMPVDAPLDVIPAYVRAGSILPLGPVMQSTSLGVEDPLEVRVYPGRNGEFTLYEDDGSTYAYEHGASSRIPMRWNDAKRTLTIDNRKGHFDGMLTMRHLKVVLPDGKSKQVVYSGKRVVVSL
jgi:alpha-glucosidase